MYKSKYRIYIILILSFALYTLLPVSPLILSGIRRDSGVFLYTGWRILHGDLPYLDVWDHKPPVIYYIDALGLKLTPESLWGVWTIEFLFLFLGLLFLFYTLFDIFGPLPAIVGIIFFTNTLIITLEGGNLTEEYALLWQFMSLWTFKRYLLTKKPANLYLLGILSSLLLFTKPTTIGISIATFVYIIFFHPSLKDLQLKILYFASGFTTITLPMLFYFHSKNALTNLIDAVFKYNLTYSSPAILTIKNRVLSLEGMQILYPTGILHIASLGFVVSLGIILYRKERDIKREIMKMGIVWIFIEFVLVTTSGRTYGHYYTTLLPSLSLFSVVFFSVIKKGIEEMGLKVVPIFSGFIIIIVLSALPISILKIYSYHSFNRAEIIDYILSHTKETDPVLFWGAETSINFLTKRVSPTRFVYQYPLYMRGYTSENLIKSFLKDIMKNPPKLLIDTRNQHTPIWEFPIMTEEIREMIKQIKNQYIYTEKIYNWKIYTLTQ